MGINNSYVGSTHLSSLKNDEGKPVHGDWQNLTMTAEFQEFRIIRFALYTMTQSPAYYQDVDDVLDLSYVPIISEDMFCHRPRHP
jgi:hypothetical protein